MVVTHAIGGVGRNEGFVPIEAYAAIGDGRGLALVAADGEIDWACLPSIADPPILSAVLDPRLGGRFSVRPDEIVATSRRYVPDTNVLETTFTSRDGTLEVLDAMTLPEDGSAASSEIVRSISCSSGHVRVRFTFEPAIGLPAQAGAFERRRETPVYVAGDRQIGVCSWGLGVPRVDRSAVSGEHVLHEGERALIAITSNTGPSLALPTRDELEHRLEETVATWCRFVARGRFPREHRDQVVRSALALRLLLQTSTGAIVAAPTTSLPERLGGSKNWDYRFAWVRDSAFTMDALSHLGYSELVHLSFSWLARAGRAAAPHIPVMYSLSGDVPSNEEHEVDVSGYRGSRPVTVGNAAAGQLQLGVYGEFFETTLLYVQHGNSLDPSTREQLTSTADLVVDLWKQKDSGMWELRGDPQHYTTSKIGCWTALDRAIRLVHLGELGSDRVPSWRSAMDEIGSFVDTRCWSDARCSYTMHADCGGTLDASVLRAVPWGFFETRARRLEGTVDAILRELADGPLVYRYSGMRGQEGAFLACSYWLVGALLAIGRPAAAEAQFDALARCANDVGLLSEEADPDGSLLGNFPQALSHLALIDAAMRLERGRSHAPAGPPRGSHRSAREARRARG
jgi:GH15 family glucan-1,4-alpha-glucosidase